MGRRRTFNEAEVIDLAGTAFLRTGYEGTSVDDLVEATGLRRGSLYSAFESKRGLFLLALDQVLGRSEPDAPDALDLALVAALELSPRDTEVRDRVATFVAALPDDPARVLGARLLSRARVAIPPTTREDGGAVS